MIPVMLPSGTTRSMGGIFLRKTGRCCAEAAIIQNRICQTGHAVGESKLSIRGLR